MAEDESGSTDDEAARLLLERRPLRGDQTSRAVAPRASRRNASSS